MNSFLKSYIVLFYLFLLGKNVFFPCLPLQTPWSYLTFYFAADHFHSLICPRVIVHSILILCVGDMHT